jgi:septum site-determining protein MinD
MGMGNGVVLAVAGSKGGVGKTTTSINLSAVLTGMDYEVVLVELDLAMANVGDFLDIDVNLEGEDLTLHEVLAGTGNVIDATYRSPSPCEFDVVPSGASLRGFAAADVGLVSEILSTLRFAYDVVILDTGAGVSRETVLPLALADETILVSSPRVAAVRDTMKTRDLTRRVGGSVAGVVFVKSGTGRSPPVERIAEFLSVDLLGHVPEDPAVARAQDVGRPVVAAESDSAAAEAYRALGARVRERVDARNAAGSGVLSVDGASRDGSGFAFLERSDGTGDDDAAVESADEVNAETATREPHTGTTERRIAADEAHGRDHESGVTGAAGERVVDSGGKDSAERVYVAPDETVGGSDGVFRAAYLDVDREERYGWACSCGNVDVVMGTTERLECGECDNRSEATRWDGASR